MSIQWTPNLAVGVDKIDDQHKELYRRLDNLFAACSENKGKEEIGKTITFLKSYVIEHFRDEESLMVKINYPDYNLQKSQHKYFIDELEKMENQFNSEGANLVLILKLNRILTDWLSNHIRTLDKKIGEYVNDK